MSASEPWEDFFAAHFPGYLLPEAYRRSLPEEAAARFLEQLGRRRDELSLFAAVSVVSAHIEDIERFALRELPHMLRSLPSITESERRSSEGALKGRLDASATLRRRLSGSSTQIVSRSRKKSFDPPENILLKAVMKRLVEIIAGLRRAGVLPSAGWGARASAAEQAIRRLLVASRLGHIADEPVTALHEEAARVSRSAAHRSAHRLYRAMRAGLDSRDPAALARLFARGALTPLEDHVRFELSVLIRLLVDLGAALERRAPGQWRCERSIVMEGRREVAVYAREDGASIALYYNQAILGPGPRDKGVRHYLEQKGRLRPDVTVLCRPLGAQPRAVVIEAKCSSDPAYLAQGYEEALLYRVEYDGLLMAWPKAILVSSAPLVGAVRREDEVIAVGWDQWVPEVVLEGMLEGM